MLEFRTEWDITEGFYGHIEGCCGRQGGKGRRVGWGEWIGSDGERAGKS